MTNTILIQSIMILTIPNQGFCINGICPDIPIAAAAEMANSTTNTKLIDIQYVRLMAQSLRATAPEKRGEMMNYALSSSDNRLKAAACCVARDYGELYLQDVITNIADTDLIVQQSARYTLIFLAARVHGEKVVDYGPMITDNGVQVSASQTMWKLWLASLSPAEKSKFDAGRKSTLGKGSLTQTQPLSKEKR